MVDSVEQWLKDYRAFLQRQQNPFQASPQPYGHILGDEVYPVDPNAESKAILNEMLRAREPQGAPYNWMPPGGRLDQMLRPRSDLGGASLAELDSSLLPLWRLRQMQNDDRYNAPIYSTKPLGPPAPVIDIRTGKPSRVWPTG